MTDHQALAKAHLMLHFTDMAAYAERPIPIIERGEGCRVIDEAGNRYIDGLSGLYCTNLGHSYGDELGSAAHEQMRALPFTSNWTVAHPRSIELAARIADLAPEGLERVFFTSGGSEAVESAWKLALQYHQANGEPGRRKAIARKDAYHGVTLGALSFTGIPVCRDPFEPMAIPVTHVSNTNAYRHPDGEDEARFTAALLEEVDTAITEEGPETVAMLIAEPVQNAGGPRATGGLLAGSTRNLRPARRTAVLRRGDLRLRPAGLLVRRGCVRLPTGPHHFRQGPHGGALRARRAPDLGSRRRAVP